MELKMFYVKEDLERWNLEREVARQRILLELGPGTDERVVRDRLDKEPIAPPKIDYISLGHTGTDPEQHFRTDMVTEMVEKGFMKISGDELIFYLYPETLYYEILRRPGRYCCHCGQKLPDDTKGELARLHIAEYHAGTASPNPEHPAGYEWITYFDVVLNKDQHEQYRKSGHPAVLKFPRKEEV